MRDVLGALEPADMVAARIHAQVDDRAVPRRHVAAGRMHEIAVEHHHRAGRPFRRDDAAFGDEPGDCVVVDRPQRIAGGGEVVLGIDHAFFVAARNEHQRAVVFVHVVQKDGHVHRALGGHHVVVEPGAVVLVPLPHIAFKGHLAVDLELVHVELFAKQIFHGLNHAGVTRQFGKGLAVHVCCKVGAHRIAAFFTHVVGFTAFIKLGHCIGEGFGFFGCEEAGEEQITFAVELFELFGC